MGGEVSSVALDNSKQNKKHKKLFVKHLLSPQGGVKPSCCAGLKSHLCIFLPIFRFDL